MYIFIIAISDNETSIVVQRNNPVLICVCCISFDMQQTYNYDDIYDDTYDEDIYEIDILEGLV